MQIFSQRVVPDVEMAIDRVAQRVAEGGHNNPQDVIRRRFDAGLRNFFGPYHLLFDGWTLLDNAALYPLTVVRNINGSVEIVDESKYTTVLRAVS